MWPHCKKVRVFPVPPNLITIRNEDKEMKIKGRISISRITSNTPHGSWVRISLEDANSFIRFVDVDIDFEQFGNAITGQSDQPCDIELRGLDFLGKKHEHKTEFIKWPRGAEEGIIELEVQMYEVDGWKRGRKDFKNYHNYVAEKSDEGYECYKVSFVRYV